MGLCTAFDLHSNNSYLEIIDENGRRVFKRKLQNDEGLIVKVLHPFKGDIEGVVVESTFNWYWAVDLLMEAGYKVHLATPSKIQKYSGLKYADDTKMMHSGSQKCSDWGYCLRGISIRKEIVRQGSSEEEGPSGETKDVAYRKSEKHHQQEPGWQDEDE